jgi:hypothetical protein
MIVVGLRRQLTREVSLPKSRDYYRYVASKGNAMVKLLGSFD